MKSLIVAAALILPVGTFAAAGFAWADTPGADWMSKDQITKKLADSGYTDIRKLEADDGHWEGDAMKDGKMMEIHVDPHSGAITKSEPKD